METKLKRPMSFLLALVVAMVFNFPIGITSGINGIFNFGMPAKAARTITPTEPETGDGTEANPYQIGTAEELYWFAAQVNSGKNTKNAKLTADIKVNDIFIDANGNLTGDIPWTPIGKNSDSSYTGTFDGAGYTISGLYFNTPSQIYVGLFGYLGTNGKIKNVGVIGSYFNGKSYVGGVCGYNSSGSITSCYNTSTVSGSGNNVGGVCGYSNQGTIENCSNTGAVSASVDNPNGGNFVGGVSGYNGKSTVKNCYNTGTVSGYQYVGGVSGKNDNSSEIESCYNTGEVKGSYTSYSGSVCGQNSSSTIINCYYRADSETDRLNGTTYKDEKAFTSGEVCYLLNGSTSESSESKKLAWGQLLSGDANADKSPVHLTTSNAGTRTVYYGYTTCDEKVPIQYANRVLSTTTRPAHDYKDNNGFCNGCGSYQPAVANNGIYAISNAGQLYWFAGLVNGTLTDGTQQNKAAKAKLTADINVNGDSETVDVADCNGERGDGWIDWTPIGNVSNIYTGTFDGDGHTISGLYFSDTSIDFVGLFGYLGKYNSIKGSIKNITVADSYFNGQKYVGSVCGADQDGTITYCYNTGTVTGENYVGGVCGYSSPGTIENCSNTGAVSGRNENVGGVCGYSSPGTIENCSNTGTVSGNNKVGGVCGYSSGKLTSCSNTGTVTSRGLYSIVGGVCGFNNTNSEITSCYSTGAVTCDSKSDNVGGVCGSNKTGTITNCYYLDSTTSDSYATSKTADQFGSGEVCYLLNGSQSTSNLVWGQLLSGNENADKSPVHLTTSNAGTHTVYGGYTTCDEKVPMQYANTTIGTAERPAHKEDNGFNCSVCNVALVGITGFKANYRTLTEDWTPSVHEVNGTTAEAEATDITVKNGSGIIDVCFKIAGKFNLVESYTLKVTDESDQEVKTVTSKCQSIFENIGMAELVHTLPDGTYNVSITLTDKNGYTITKTTQVTVPTSAEEPAA